MKAPPRAHLKQAAPRRLPGSRRRRRPAAALADTVLRGIGWAAIAAAFTLPGCGGEEAPREAPPAPYTALDGNAHNPIVETMELADPHVIRHGGRYYLYATDGSGGYLGYDVYLSEDLADWAKGPRVFEHPGPNVWAPDVFADPDSGLFYLYYSADRDIGVAVADGPQGPFEDRGILVEQAIDAHLFRDEDGKLFLYYSEAKPIPEYIFEDGLGSALMVQPMQSPLEAAGTPPVELLRPEGWERFLGIVGICEAPWMLKRGGVYYLMYSGNAASSVDYAVGYATGSSPTGPFTRFDGNPVLSKSEGILGPGHHAVVETPDGGLAMVYHQKTTEDFLWFAFGDRVLCADRMGFDEKDRIWVAPTPLR